MVQTPNVLPGADVLLQGVIAPGDTDLDQEAEEEGGHDDGDGVRRET